MSRIQFLEKLLLITYFFVSHPFSKGSNTVQVGESSLLASAEKLFVAARIKEKENHKYVMTHYGGCNGRKNQLNLVLLEEKQILNY